MRAAAVTITLFALAGLLWVMGGRWMPTGGDCACPHAAKAQATKKKPAVELTNRIWRNKTPKDGRDLTFHLVLFDKAKIRTGAIAHLSEWRYYIDRVRYRLKGKELIVESPQDGTRAKFQVRTWRCKGEAPAPYDMCLELKQGNRKVTLYSERNAGFSRRLADLERTAYASGPLPACEACTEATPEWFDRLALGDSYNP